jgi:hypothetical protein
MISKMVVDRQKSSAAAVAAAEKNHGKAIVDGLSALYGADVGPAAALLLERAAARLAADTGAMVAANDANLKELADDAEGMARRDEAAAAVYAALVEFREVGTAVYGDAYMRKLGFEGTTTRDAVALDRLAALVLDNAGAVAPPAPRRNGLALDAHEWTAPLTTSRQALSAALSEAAAEV